MLFPFSSIPGIFKKLHKRQGKYKTSGKSHNRYYKQNNPYTCVVIATPHAKEFVKEVRTQFSRINSKEERKNYGRIKTGKESGHETFLILKFSPAFQPVIFNGQIHSK